MAEPFIIAENLSFTYTDDDGDSTEALKNVSFVVNRGEYVAVLGHNGSGKSTLAKLINVILTPTSGSLTVGGRKIHSEMPDDEVFDVRRDVGMVFQNPDNQLVATIVEEDVAFGPENLGIPREEIRMRVDDALETVGMYEYRDSQPHRLSGGQKQRVAIAGVIAMQTNCIVLDEPTAMLDPKGRREVMNALLKLKNDLGISVILVTHFMDEAVKADRVVVMNDGKACLDGSPAEVFSHSALLKNIGLAVPKPMELAVSLKENGVDLKETPLTTEEFIKLFKNYIDNRG